MVSSPIAIAVSAKKRKSLDEQHPVMDSAVAARPIKQRKYHQFLPQGIPQSLGLLLPRSASTSPAYPNFDLYPDSAYDEMDIDPPSASKHGHKTPVGLRQPREGSQWNHHTCSQIPKLQVAKHPGLNGQRALYTLCPQCGAINIVGEA